MLELKINLNSNSINIIFAVLSLSCFALDILSIMFIYREWNILMIFNKQRHLLWTASSWSHDDDDDDDNLIGPKVRSQVSWEESMFTCWHIPHKWCPHCRHRCDRTTRTSWLVASTWSTWSTLCENSCPRTPNSTGWALWCRCISRTSCPPCAWNTPRRTVGLVCPCRCSDPPARHTTNERAKSEIFIIKQNNLNWGQNIRAEIELSNLWPFCHTRCKRDNSRGTRRSWTSRPCPKWAASIFCTWTTG